MGAVEALGGSLYDGIEHAVGVFVRLVVPDAKDRPALLLQMGVAPGIADRLRVLASVEFDDQLGLAASEVGDVRANGKLTSELGPKARDPLPEFAFVRGRTVA